MSDILNAIDNLPDISLIDGLSLEDIQGRMLANFQEKYHEATGKRVNLSKSDPNRILLLGCAQMIYQGLQQIDKAGKMNFLKYAYDEYLDSMAALKKVTRNPAKYAQVPVKFILSGKRESATGIPAGTRVTADHEVYFATVQYVEIPAGETEAMAMAECTQAGTIGNDFAAGEITTLVDPVAFISKIENTEKSAGGMETESDQSMAERACLAPASYSTAGPDDAYAYWVRESSPLIGDVRITSPSPGVVDIRFIMTDGSIPDDAAIAAVEKAVSQRGKRPLTDLVQVGVPETEEYSIDVTYYINASDRNQAAAIQTQAVAAVEEYKGWQDCKIGRDINPDELTARLNDAGAKRAVIRSPSFLVIGASAKARCMDINIVYGGLEDD